MLWPGTRWRLKPEIADRLALVRGQNSEAKTWLTLVEAALAESEDVPRWHVAISAPTEQLAARAPLLQGAQITVDERPVRNFVRRLARLAALTNGRDAPNRSEALRLVEAAICQDDARIEALARGDPSTLRVVAQVATIPLLVAAAQAVGGAVSPAWWEGYCPVCGAWPTLAEFRGLERKRWLRCGRCASAWEMPLLRCPFCGETHHEHLGYLAPDEGETSRKVEVCDTCKGYLKTEPTVSALPWWGVVLDDAATVALDVAALDRGYHRPERPGWALEAKVMDVGGGSRGWWRT